jgi:phosphoribosyl 1,2-cyclic phosphate phosphodiesterase
VPFIGCDCAVCTSADKRDNRLRTSVWIHADGTDLVVDTGPDFRYQMLRSGLRNLDAILFTHSHKDHVAGLDDVRAFNYFQHRAMDVWASDETATVLRREFAYVFNDAERYPGIPQIDMHRFENAPFRVNGVEIIPVRVLHYKMEVFGFRIGGLTYITDANHIAPEELKKCAGSSVLVLNALRHETHISHFNLEEAIAVAREIGATSTYFIHISHQLGLHAELNARLPVGMQLAYDGLQVPF